MKEVRADKKFLDEFLLDLKFEDKLEIDALNRANFLDDFYNVCLKPNKYTYFLQSKNNKPLALGGAYYKENQNIARVWLLCTNELRFHKKELYKYVKNKINFFKDEFDILFNYIYKSNFSSLFWLEKCGFSVYDFNNGDYKLFYYLKGEMQFDLRYFAC